MLGRKPESESSLDYNGDTRREIRISEEDIETLLDEGEIKLCLLDGNRNTHPKLTLVENGGDDACDDS